MKTLHKGLVVTVALALSGVTVWSAAAGRLRDTAPASEAPLAADKALAGAEKAAVAAPLETAAKAETPAPDKAAPEAVDGEAVSVPSDLKITVRESKTGWTLKAQRQGHLVAVRRGNERKVGMHEISWPIEAKSAGSFTWESTSPKTLETLRGRVNVGNDGGVALENTVKLAVVGDDTRFAHVCRGHSDGAGGFVVLCSVDGVAAATSVDGNEARDGVWSQAGDKTLVRFDLPMSGEGATTRVLGYEKAGKGVVVRVEASRAACETNALLAIGSDSRAQPQPVRRMGCFCVMPMNDRDRL